MTKRRASAVRGVTTGADHVAGIGDLRVLLVEEDGAWHAQGLEIDCVAQGGSVERAKENFEVGLHAMIRENLKILGSIERLLTPAPPEIWKERLSPRARAKRLSHLSVHRIGRMSEVASLLPFDGIAYLRAEADA